MTVSFAPPGLAPPTAQTAALALASKETRLFLRSPWLWGGAALAAALCTTWGWTTEPVWDTFASNAGMASLVLAGVVLLLTHLAASRDHRHGATEASSTLPASARRRTLALLALVPAAGAVAAVTLTAELLALLPSWPAGVADPWNLLTVAVLPMTGAAVGVTVGRWLPATATGPLAAFACAAGLAVLPVLGPTSGSLAWLLFPVTLEENLAPGFPRPTGWHLLYLLVVLLAVVAAALSRHWRAVPATAVVLALIIGTVAVRHQQDEQAPGGPGVAASYLGPAAQRCEQHDRVGYCPLPGYGRWVPIWRESVEPVVRAVPPSAGALPAVRQGDGPATSATVDLRWGRHGGWAVDSRLALREEYVRVLLGLPGWTAGEPGPGGLPEQNRGPWPTGSVQLDRGVRCSGAGQLRTVVALYLVAQSDSDGRWLLGGDGRMTLGSVQIGAPERAAAAKLLDAPRQAVTAVLAERWTEIRSPAPAGRSLVALGVSDLAPANGTRPGEGSGPPCP
jgi:hypothetical protein